MPRAKPISYKQTQASLAMLKLLSQSQRGRLLDSHDVGHGVEGGGLGDQPFGGSQGASDQGVTAVGGVVEGDLRCRSSSVFA
jgi:hypothetical protein